MTVAEERKTARSITGGDSEHREFDREQDFSSA